MRVHRWLNAPGEDEICVEHQRPGEVDEEVLAKLQEMGVSGQGVVDSVKHGRHDHIHTTYQVIHVSRALHCPFPVVLLHPPLPGTRRAHSMARATHSQLLLRKRQQTAPLSMEAVETEGAVEGFR